MRQVYLSRLVSFFGRTPVHSFLLLPLVIVLWESWWRRGQLNIQSVFLLLMPWGFLQYRLCGLYRLRRGGGGPGLNKPPERLVVNGPYACTRNPMYLGHLIALIGITLALSSLLGALITVARAIWFHYRVLYDEQRLARQFGQPYLEYQDRVKRWIPGVF